jgi:hypothetical protein
VCPHTKSFRLLGVSGLNYYYVCQSLIHVRLSLQAGVDGLLIVIGTVGEAVQYARLSPLLAAVCLKCLTTAVLACVDLSPYLLHSLPVFSVLWQTATVEAMSLGVLSVLQADILATVLPVQGQILHDTNLGNSTKKRCNQKITG